MTTHILSLSMSTNNKTMFWSLLLANIFITCITFISLGELSGSEWYYDSLLDAINFKIEIKNTEDEEIRQVQTSNPTTLGNFFS